MQSRREDLPLLLHMRMTGARVSLSEQQHSANADDDNRQHDTVCTSNESIRKRTAVHLHTVEKCERLGRVVKVQADAGRRRGLRLSKGVVG